MEKESKEEATSKGRIRTAFKVSFIYIAIVALWFAISSILEIVLGDIVGAGSFPTSVRYVTTIIITSIIIFFAINKVLKELDESKNLVHKVSEELKTKKESIKIASKGLNQHRKLIQDLIENASILIVRLDKDMTIIKASNNIMELVNFKADDLAGENLSKLVDPSKVLEKVEKLEDQESSKLEVEVKTKYGKKLTMQGNIKRTSQIFKGDGYYTMVLCDVTDREKLQRKVNYLDSYDVLTGLPNRELLEKTFLSLLPEIDKQGNPVALLYVDIDDFNLINETKGYHVGDQLLLDMSDRLKQVMKETDILARLTQDKFIVAIVGESSIEDIDKRVKEISSQSKMDWIYDDEKYIISATIGASIYPETSSDYFELLKDASLALKYAKSSSRTSYEYYSKGMEEAVINDLTIVSDIKTALKNEDFQMYYQPIKDLETGKLCNAESLIRWFHPERGYISPMDFIPIAEKSGIIDEISEYSLERVFKQKKIWNESGYKLPKIAINVSAISFSKHEFFHFIKWKLEKYDLKPSEIVLELTESSFESYQGEIKNNIEKLREIGIEVAMDDFGTGYSSLARLRDLQLDYLKLDRSFITSLFEENGQEIIEPLIALAKILGKSVIAEGIETQEQYDVLRSMGCQYGQGYFLARPMPAEDLMKS